MPLPKPNVDEAKNEFIDRCMSDNEAIQEFQDDSQRVAVCLSLWEDKLGNNKREQRVFQFDEIRVVEENNEPVIEGYAAVFNKLSEDLGGFRERIKKGAFTKTLQEADVRALVNHDSNFVLGRNTAGTLDMTQDRKGLKIRVTPPRTTWASDLLESMRRGDIDQMSFGFRTIKEKWFEEGNESVRELREVQLFDVSVVTFPAYPDTSVGVRSLEDKDLRKAVLKAEKGLTLNDNDVKLIDNAVKELKNFLPIEPVVNHSQDVRNSSLNKIAILKEQLKMKEKVYDNNRAQTRESKISQSS